MKHTIKILLSCMLIVAMVAVPLAACGKTDATSKTSEPATGSSTDPEKSVEVGEIDTSDFAKITMLVLGNKPTNGRMEEAVAAENEAYKERINAELQLQYIEWADWQTNYQLALASGDSSIDLIITATDWLFAWQSVRKGAFLPLSEEMLSTYAPQTWAAVPAEHWAAATMEEQIWFFPEDQLTQWTNHGMFYRGDWAAEAGLDKITNFNQLEEYYQFIVDNKEGVIPWDISGSQNQAGLLPGYVQSHHDSSGILGAETGNFLVYNYDNADPYTVVSPFMDDESTVDFAKLMKSWADKGFWREDVLNYQGETRDLMYAGSSGSDQHHVETYVYTTRPQMDENQPGSDLQIFYWGQENGNYNRDLITHGAMAVSASSKNPERALMLYDILRNDKDIYRLHNYGFEGVDYILNEDGSLGRPEGFDATSDSLDTNFWGGRVDANNIERERRAPNRDELYVELESAAKNYQLSKFAFDPTAVSAQVAAMAEVCATHIPTIAYGKVADPEAAVAAFRAELQSAGYEEVKAEIQRQLDELKAQEG